MAGESYASFDQVKARLDEIVDAVGSSEMPLDEALSLYEEAVGLGLRASELLEENIEARDAEDGTEDGAEDEADATGREAGAGAAGETEAAGPDAEASATAAAQA